jgi:hypothetical protein
VIDEPRNLATSGLNDPEFPDDCRRVGLTLLKNVLEVLVDRAYVLLEQLRQEALGQPDGAPTLIPVKTGDRVKLKRWPKEAMGESIAASTTTSEASTSNNRPSDSVARAHRIVHRERSDSSARDKSSRSARQTMRWPSTCLGRDKRRLKTDRSDSCSRGSHCLRA